MDEMNDMPVPEATPDAMGGEEISDEQHQELLALLEKVKHGSAQLESSQFVLDAKGDEAKREALRYVFDALAERGINLQDPASVAEFMEKLKIQNPDLYELFEEAMSQLLGEDDMTYAEASPAPTPEGLSGVPEDVRGLEAETVRAPVLPE